MAKRKKYTFCVSRDDWKDGSLIAMTKSEAIDRMVISGATKTKAEAKRLIESWGPDDGIDIPESQVGYGGHIYLDEEE